MKKKNPSDNIAASDIHSASVWLVGSGFKEARFLVPTPKEYIFYKNKKQILDVVFALLLLISGCKRDPFPLTPFAGMYALCVVTSNHPTFEEDFE